MKTYPERFNRAIKALITAFFDDTLAASHCSACAVGNMVAAGYGTKVIKTLTVLGNLNYECSIPNNEWSRIFCTHDDEPYIDTELGTDLSFENIKVTGYSILQLSRIEQVFEKATNINFEDYSKCSKEMIMQDQYNGLVAVFGVLCDIEELSEDKEHFKSLLAYDVEFKPINECSIA